MQLAVLVSNQRQIALQHKTQVIILLSICNYIQLYSTKQRTTTTHTNIHYCDV